MWTFIKTCNQHISFLIIILCNKVKPQENPWNKQLLLRHISMFMVDLRADQFPMHLTHRFDQVMLHCNHNCVRIKVLSWSWGRDTGWTSDRKWETKWDRKQEMCNRNSIHVPNTDVTQDRNKEWACDHRASKKQLKKKKLMNTTYGLINKQVESLPDTTCCW